MEREPAVRSVSGLGRELVGLLRSQEISFLAAGIAYYAFVSLIPSLTLAVVVASVVGGESLATTLVGAAGDVLSPVGQELVETALVGATGRAPATLVSVALLVWSTLKVFRGLDVAFSQVYGTEPAASFLGRIRDAALALAGVGLGFAALVAINAFVGLSGVAVAAVLGPLAVVVVLTVVFFPLFYLFPDQSDPPSLVVPGTVVAAGAWTVLGTVFRVYASVAGQFDVYGVLGVVLLLVTWFYLGSMALLLGAAVNAVLAGRTAETGTNKGPRADMTTNDSA